MRRWQPAPSHEQLSRRPLSQGPQSRSLSRPTRTSSAAGLGGSAGHGRSRTVEPAVCGRDLQTPLGPCLCFEVISFLAACGGSGIYADCTFGGGGHARALLKKLAPNGRLLAIDVDPIAIAEARTLAAQDSRVRVHHIACSELSSVVPEGQQLSGVLFDLGFNEASERDPRRGLTIHDDFPCDLRMNPTLGEPANEWLSHVSSDELAWVIREYGDDEDALIAARIAEGIAHRRKRQPFRTAREMADFIGRVKGGMDPKGRHPALGTFKAIRTFLNREPQQLRAGMMAAFERLRMGGRCIVITYNRWELVAARRFGRDFEDYDKKRVLGWSLERLTQLYPLLTTTANWSVTEVCSPILPTQQEADVNKRSRSARALVFEKVPRSSSPSPALLHPVNSSELERLLFQRPDKVPVFVGETANDDGRETAQPSIAESPLARSLLTESTPGSVLTASASVQGSPDPWFQGADPWGRSAKTFVHDLEEESCVRTPPLAVEESIAQWLEDMSSSPVGGEAPLLCYHDVLLQRYGSVEGIIQAACPRPGEVDMQFFAESGIHKLGHRKLFERWFASNRSVRRDPNSGHTDSTRSIPCRLFAKMPEAPRSRRKWRSRPPSAVKDQS